LGISLDINNNIFPSKILILSVKNFHDRISNIRNQFEKVGLNFDFIFKYDIDEFENDPIIKSKFEENSLKQPHQSLILKHIFAWELCVKNKYKTILVLEDDAILNSNFLENIEKLRIKSQYLLPGYLIFLSGRDTRVPKEFLLSNDLLFKLSMPTADGYITDYTACEKRLNWIKNNLIGLPADHLIKKIDQEVNNIQYWSTKYLIEQGSVFGLYQSVLDEKRKKKSAISNLIRYYMKIISRRTLKKIYYQLMFYKIK
jgi:glycosyl transferase family 25